MGFDLTFQTKLSFTAEVPNYSNCIPALALASHLSLVPMLDNRDNHVETGVDDAEIRLEERK
jgi:hypothetical protein